MTDQPPPPLPEDPHASVFGQPAEPVADVGFPPCRRFPERNAQCFEAIRFEADKGDFPSSCGIATGNFSADATTSTGDDNGFALQSAGHARFLRGQRILVDLIAITAASACRVNRS